MWGILPLSASSAVISSLLSRHPKPPASQHVLPFVMNYVDQQFPHTRHGSMHARDAVNK